VGRVVGSHGLEGLLKVFSSARTEASLLSVGTIFLRSTLGEVCEFPVSSVRPHKNIFLVKLKGVCTRGDAEKQRGKEVLVHKEDISREDHEYFWYELIGLKVYLITGRYLGTISRIIPTGANDIYVVKKREKEVLIPATYDVVKEISIENGKMIVSAMEGLLDLNEV
jgi:16S rRNA processing protein RimM